MIRLLILLAYGACSFIAGIAYDAHAQRKAREIIESFDVQQSTIPLPARILRP